MNCLEKRLKAVEKVEEKPEKKELKGLEALREPAEDFKEVNSKLKQVFEFFDQA